MSEVGTSEQAIIEAARSRAVIFDRTETRGILEVSGSDRVRWLDGMISGDVEAIVAAAAEGRPETGCYATLLTNRGAIVADLHVGCVGEVLILESLRSALPNIAATLDRFIIADDVELKDQSDAFLTLSLEGPLARSILEAALEEGSSPPVSEAWQAAKIAGQEVLIGGFGLSGELAYQIRMSPDARESIIAALNTAAESQDSAGALVRGSDAAAETLRVEAGIPLLGRELDEDVLPPEARLERAIAVNKGCYVGQEIVARLRARGQVNHLLVGLTLPADAAIELGAELEADGRKTGEITSLALSPTAGSIALGYVRREHSEAGTVVEFAGGQATVTALPFVQGSAAEAETAEPA